jgi:glycosyltransferase involved in cell wall biosynthesis
MPVILSHPLGNANVKAIAKGLADAGLLTAFNVSIASFEGDFLDKIAKGPLSEIKRRRFDDILKQYTHSYPFYEAGRLLSLKLGLKNLLQHETGLFCIDAVNRKIDAYTANNLDRYKKQGAKAVYAYEDAAEYSFEAAKKLNLTTLYDLPIGYWRSMRRLLEEEKKNRPEWASTLTSFKDSENKLARKDKELQLADNIFVASSFTAKTLAEYPQQLNNIEVIPYGFPAVTANKKYTSIKNRKLKLLFVGGLSQRKGIANIFEAVEGLKDYVELTIVGKKNTEDCLPLNEGLKKHNWIVSLSHNKVLELMKESDVLLFPSLFEGFGLVITEAMSCGTPVITTERTIGPDIIMHNKNGWLINAGKTEELKQVLKNILDEKIELELIGTKAIETAQKRPWRVYSNSIAAKISSIINN